MITDIRWVYHDFSDGPPPQGAIRVGDRLYQKLQVKTDGGWMNVPCAGVQPATEEEYLLAPIHHSL